MISIRKSTFHKSLLIASVLVLLLTSYEITFLVWSLSAFVSLRNRYSVQISKLILVFSVIMLIALFSSFFRDFRAYNFFRDVAYLLKPILGLLVGYNFCKSVGKQAIITIIYSGVALAAIHIATVGFYYVVFGIRNINELRQYGGYFDDYEIYILVLLLFYKKFDIGLKQTTVYLFIAVIACSSFLYLARTNIIQFLILVLAMKGHLRMTKRSLGILGAFIIISSLSYTAIYYSYPQRNAQGLEAFFYKIKIAPIEAFKTHINENDWKEFNDNYRSFENIITVKQVTGHGWFTIIFGEGMGSTIDIGREMWTNDGEYIRYVPALHNSYMTIFLKSGLLGVLLLIYSMRLVYKHPKANSDIIRNINYLLVGSAVFLILSNWVFMGFYLKLDNKSIFIGFLLCYKELLLKEQEQYENT
ncbi:hypothetical protein [Flavobacterium pallidum]|uniref:hypothetical protein n=1 Tax=Flavobacterium pallidum TaxID=2172098 RepID=UPI0011B2175E|nr:hypothetical protein [Flavobacterium pallidum]